MNKKSEIELPAKIKPYLDEIADRLWTGHSTVMIGSGFSKNASDDFPDWNQLGNVFYEKIHGRSPQETDHYLNVLKLADEVQAAFGRPALDQLVRIQISDNEFEPSELHTKLLRLPWVDVFTTNYDTLLEKAAKNVIAQRFDIVVNKEDLVYSEKPRIIKLHGSFPSERPFVITEEDYRKYPKEFAPFVNTVQQSLIENTLCLIGFSGDDPNFLQWIGWIRDNLEKGFFPKIFLIGIFKLSEPQKKLIEERNIVLIDMSVCDDVGNDYKKALNIFFDYLNSKKGKFSYLDWPLKQTHRDHNSDYLSQIKGIIPEWKKQREEYPGWLVLPEDRRNLLWWDIQDWIDFQTTKSDLPYPFDIEFLYEFNWRLEKCLCPILGDFIKFYELIIEKYNPFPELFEMSSATVTKGIGLSEDGVSWDEIGNNWLELQISMMRFYREEGLIKQWNSLNSRFQLLQSRLSIEQNSRLCYERCLFALFSLDVEELRRQLQQWSVDEKLPFWSAKRAGLIAEQGDFLEAEKILEKALTAIRKKLNLAPVSNDYTYVSQESYVMLLYNFVRDAIDLGQRRSGSGDKVRQEFHERWHFLKQFKCDPWNELKLFEACLEKEPSGNRDISEKHEFDIGRITTTHHFCRRNAEEISAYSFLRWYEDAGLLFEVLNMTLGKKAVEEALKRISSSSSYWSVALLLRMGDTKLVDSIFDREKIYKMDIQQIDDLIANYLAVINNVKLEIEKADWFNKENFGIRLAGVIPEILSRLCLKCSKESREKIFDFLYDIYKSEQIFKYHNIAHLVERIMESITEVERYAKIPDLLKFPIVSKNSVIDNDFPDPFRFLSVSEETIANLVKVEIDNQEIDKLLDVVAGTDIERRKRAIWRLARLLDAGLLKKEKAIEFANVLWGQLDCATGFPAHVDFLKSSFLSLPYPPGINPEGLFKKYINTLSFPIQGHNKGINITFRDIPIFEELLYGTKTFTSEKGVDWAQQEAIETFLRLLDWWDSDKEYLRKEKKPIGFNDITEEFKRRFKNLVKIATIVVIPKLSMQIDNSLKSQISRLLAELEEYGMPCLSARAISISIFPEMRNNIYKEVNMAVLSSDKEIIRDGYDAIYQLLLLNKFRNAEAVPVSILSYISTPIKWRDNFRLIDSMNIVNKIVWHLPDLLPKEMIDDILIGLDGLINETPLGILGVQLDFSEKLDQRYVAASLAHALFKYIESKNEPISDTLTRWKTICSDINEFAEIRNQWQRI